MPSICTKLITASRNAKPTTPGPTMVGMILCSGARNAAQPLIRNPASGSTTIAQSSVGSCTLPAQQVEVLHVHGLQVPENRDDDRQPNRGFRCCNGHYEEYKDLPL